ncbi:hypothetical protein HK100_002289 [Physocladia obscura]|uniref:Dienelactone hydrolase domain-containing protein n=1 Tax=Physocladia obscura TaxID=109957 RepID=A0AAD5TD59_9FUNG|nr:hypothetical protein HK100_002289 [Physocladia obscura]
MSSIACCKGVVESGVGTGRVEQIGGHSAYVAWPAENSNDGESANKLTLVVIATDIFGFTLPNSRLIADRFASRGFACVVPDLFNGSEMPADIMDSLEKNGNSKFGYAKAFLRFLSLFPLFILRNSSDKGCTIITEVIAALNVSHSFEKVAVQGYCWGGSIAIKIAQKPDIADVVAAAHPGGMIKIPGDIELIQKPIYFVLAEIDNQIGIKEREKIKNSLAKKQQIKSKVDWFEGVEHGFAVRGSTSDPHVNAQKDKAFEASIEFFNSQN